MSIHPPSTLNFHAATRAWESRAAGAPTLRGRRLDRDAPCLHFVHGNGFCGGTYWPFLRGLSGDYGLFCHDLEGHGSSDAPARFSGIRPLVHRIGSVIAEQDLPRPGQPLIGVGHSFGGALTVRAAAAQPGLFRALVLLDPILIPPLPWALLKIGTAAGRNPMSHAARRRRTLWPSADAVFHALHDRGTYRGWTDEALRCFVDYATHDTPDGRRLSCPPELEASIFEHPVYPWRALRRLRCPVLFIYGRDSYPFMPGAAARAARIHPGIEVRDLEGGHCFMLEHPVETAQAVRQWLQGLQL